MRLLKKILILTLCFLFTFPAAAARAANYTIAPKDTLYSLSKLFNTSVTYLQYSNNVNEKNLIPGEVIYVPAHMYKVKSGDSLYKIAVAYGLSVSALKKANGKTGDLIVPGEKLILPGVKPSENSDHVIPYSSGEVDLLARLIEAEASGESMKANVAVGAVVVNRVQSGDWASTITGVINQKFGEYYQFTPVKNGMINNTPSDASKKAAWIAMFGGDPSNGAIFYFDSSSTNQWLWSKPKTAWIDHMVFAK